MAPNLEAKWHGIPLTYVALTTMAIQNASAALIMHYSRVMPGYEDRRFMTSTAVFMSEVMKLVLCTFVVRRQHVAASDARVSWLSTLRQIFPRDSWKLAVPAALYVLQNNLQYIAMSNLDAATFQITYQLKIITTAIASVVLLRKQLNATQWSALLLLTVGVALVSLKENSTTILDETHRAMRPLLGLVCIVIACSLSGLAGVYFEKVMKGSKSSMWTLNIQLSFFSLFPAFFLGVLGKDGSQVRTDGFFFGYNWVVWISILIQAGGGLIVAACVLYTDNIRKNFATSIAVLLSAVASVLLFDFVITKNFCLGASAVIYATFLYGRADGPAAEMNKQLYDMEKQTSSV